MDVFFNKYFNIWIKLDQTSYKNNPIIMISVIFVDIV